jgi:transcriptional regulator with XRE-family HTH domain
VNRYIGERIRKAREQFGISQKTLADSIGLSDKAISTYESGRTLPPLDILFKIADTLKKEILYFIDENEEHILMLEKVEKVETLLAETKYELFELRKYLEEKNSVNLVPPNVPV